MSDVRQFWDEQAQQHGASPTATSPDWHYRELEIKRILPWLRHGPILDVGCGNGYSTFKFADEYPDAVVCGIDYSVPMIRAAKSIRGNRLQPLFLVADVRDLFTGPICDYRYGSIVTERCLINLASWKEQQKAILNLRDILRGGGRLILVENMMDGLISLNSLRGRFGLPQIQQRWHNNYMELGKLLPFLREHFTVRAVHNIGNLYYILSRVVYAKIAQMQGVEPRYDHPINAIASTLPSFVRGRYSPNYLIVCEL